MIELNVNNLTKYYGANKLFQDISFEIQTGERIGLIGQNGCGKTTLMKVLMGTEDYQGGTVSFRKGSKLGYLNQIPRYEEGTTTIEVIRMAFDEISEIRQQMDELEQQMSHLEGALLDKAVAEYSRLLERYEHGGGYEIETRVNKITEGLQISEEMKQMSFELLSGGEKTRVILAKILLEEPDILLLDEPTNHLDLVTIEWLEGFLKDYKGAALIVSHDRYFLDSVVNKIVELETDHAETYLGSYSYYVIERERRFLIAMKNYQAQQRKIQRMEEQIKRYRIWGAMRDSEKMFKRAKELEKRLEKIEIMKRPVFEKRRIRLNNEAVGRSGRIVLETTDLTKSFGNRPLLRDIGINVFYQDSACIIGENGSGKTTLLKLLLGELEPDTGTIKIGSQVIIGYLPQQVEYPDEEQTVLEYFARLHDLTYGAARSQLAKALFFEEDVNKRIKILSGGEKSRLKLCSLTFCGVNLLILDEPTNHLDIDSREVLEETLSEFDGTILFVSHDRYFISKLADKIISIEEGTAKQYDGDYEYYQSESRKAAAHINSVKPAQTGKTPRPYQTDKIPGSNQTDKISRSDQTDKAPKGATQNTERAASKPSRKLELIEKNIEELEEKRSWLDEMMELYSTDSIRLHELYQEKQQLEEAIKIAYTDWELLQC